MPDPEKAGDATPEELRRKLRELVEDMPNGPLP